MSKEFTEMLHKLCAQNMHGQDPDRMSDTLEALSSSLSFTIAFAGQGDKDTIELLLTGVHNYILEEAIRLAPVAKLSAYSQSGGKSQ